MARIRQLKPEFVKSVPEKLSSGTLYVSMEYASVLHLCCCGCGNEVVTPLSPKNWKLTFNGETVTLHPSIGNWSFPCRSHYWIRSNRVVWAGDMTDREIQEARKRGGKNRIHHDQGLEEKTKSPEVFWRKLLGLSTKHQFGKPRKDLNGRS